MCPECYQIVQILLKLSSLVTMHVNIVNMDNYVVKIKTSGVNMKTIDVKKIKRLCCPYEFDYYWNTGSESTENRTILN